MADCEDNIRLFDCWSDDGGSGTPCRPCGVRRPQLYCGDDASDTSLHSCNSAEALKQWTTTTMFCPRSSNRSARCCFPSSRKRRSKSAGGDNERRNGSSDLHDANDFNTANYNCCTTTKKRLMNQSRNAANCLLSDTSDNDADDQQLDDEEVDVDVDDDRPALVELMSCNSSFSDCSLPCHELITCSPQSQLAKGQVKVSIRPPKVSANNECFDDDRYNIKFVSHFVDIPNNPDNEEADETKSENGKKDKQKADKTRRGSSDDETADNGTKEDKQKADKTRRGSRGSSDDQTADNSKKERGSRKSSSSSTAQSRRSTMNKNTSSRTGRNRSPTTSEQSEMEKSYDDMNDIRGMSNSNSRRSKTWRRYSSDDSSQSTQPMSSSNRNDIRGMSNSDSRRSKTLRRYNSDDSSQSTQPMSSSNDDDDEDQETNRGLLTDLDSDKSDDREIVMLYGQVRQIIRGPAFNDPADVQRLPTAEVAKAEEYKETLSSTTVVTNAPHIIDPIQKTSDQTDRHVNEKRDTAIVSLPGDVENDESSSPTSNARSEAARKAGRAACARAARTQPHKTQSQDGDYRCLSSTASTNNINATPWSHSVPRMTELRDSADDVSEYSSMEDAGLVAARRTTPLYGRGKSPWFADQSLTQDLSNDRAAAAAPPEMSEPTWLSSSPHPSPLNNPQWQRHQQQHHAAVKRCRTDSMTALPRRPRPDVARLRNELDYLTSPAGVTANLPLEGAVGLHRSDRKIIVAHVTADSSTMLQPLSRRQPPTAAPLPSCLKYTSAASNPQRRRKIRFAPEVKQRTVN